MHAEAYRYVRRFGTTDPIDVIEIGARNVNFTVRPLFPNASYWGIDAQPGPCVDEVADGALWRPLSPVDMVVCCEVFEHTPDWADIVGNIRHMLIPGGRAVFTCAGPGRPVHGVNADDPLNPGHYANVSVDELNEAMVAAGFVRIETSSYRNRTCGGGHDTQATALVP